MVKMIKDKVLHLRGKVDGEILRRGKLECGNHHHRHSRDL